MTPRQGQIACAFALAQILIVGCSQGPAVGTVNGEVTFDAKPLKEGRVLFTPIGGQGQTGGAIITDGKFSSKVPVAKMKVEINANKVVGKHRVYEGDPNSPVVDEIVELIPHKYNATSELTIDVQRGEQSVKYDLKSK